MKRLFRKFFTTLLPLVYALHGAGQHVVYPSFDGEGSKWQEKNSGRTTSIKYNGNKYVEDVKIYAVVDLGVIANQYGRTYHVDVLSHNIGAENNWDYGDYYAWGEVETYYVEGHSKDLNPPWRTGKTKGYHWNSYRYFNFMVESPYTTKYVTRNQVDWYDSSISYPDGKTVLEADDDIATKTFGDKFAIPTQAEWKAIYDQCYWEWTDDYDNTGTDGFIIYKSKHKDDKQRIKRSPDYVTYSIETDIHVFLPCACNRYDLDVCGNPYLFEDNVNNDVYYWSSTLSSTAACDALMLFIRRGRGEGNEIFTNFVRSAGTPIRAIRRRY